MKKIFMTCYGGGHVRIIKNVYDELIKNKELDIKILALTEAQKYLSSVNIPYQTIEKYHEIVKDGEAEKIGKEIIKKLNLNFNDKESILYYGYSFKELIEKYGEKKVIEGYSKFGRRIFLQINFMRKILEYEKPDIVITTTAPRLEKAALITSKELRIPSISIEDLFGIEIEEDTNLTRFFNNSNYKYQYGDYVCVLSESIKDFLKDKTNSKIFVTGNPNFDQIVKIKEQVQKINIDKKYYVITFLSQAYQDQNRYIEKMLEILNKNKNYFIIFKFHPTENVDNYKNIFDKNEKLRERYLLLKDKLYESIKTADIVITRTSTAALEANILEKKIIGEKNIYIPFKKSKIGTEFLDIEKLEETINNVKNIKKINSTYSKELASIKIKKIVFDILNEKI